MKRYLSGMLLVFGVGEPSGQHDAIYNTRLMKKP